VPLPAAPDGFYRVRRGDTLIGISLDHGAAWRDIAAWNQIENPNLIEIDQLLRVRPPNSPSKQIAVAPKTDLKTDSKTTVQPINPAVSKGGAGAPGPSNPGANPATTNAASANPAPNAATAAKPVAAENIALSWPGRGQVITQFSDPGYKGIAISGVEGDPVSAAGDGRVVYSGNGLRGYGNLVIVKHDGDFLTAYAHNKSILVSEGQTVKRGQKIAELGKTDSDIPKLHFEVRRSGKPVDPLKFLAQR
jgi:lipoprotein NlpD